MERITLANEAGGIGVWEWNVATNEMSWDKRMFAIYELELTDRPTYKFWLRRLHPDDRPMAEEAVRRALEEGEPLPRSAVSLPATAFAIFARRLTACSVLKATSPACWASIRMSPSCAC